MREVDYRVDVLRNGARLTVLDWDVGTPPSVICNAEESIQRAMSGTFRHNGRVDWLKDEFQPVLIVNGQETPLGVFRCATKTDAHSARGKDARIEFYDRTWQLYLRKTESILHLSAGSPYLTVIGQLLTACGIVLTISESSDAVLATDREDWGIGTSYLQIINALLAEINYDPVWFDGSGLCHLSRYKAPDVSIIRWSYSEQDVWRSIGEDYSVSVDVFNAPNVFLVVCNNPDNDEVLTARAENDNPLSEKSIFRRGLRIATTEYVNNTASQEDLQAYADRLCAESMLSTELTTFETLNEGGHNSGDIISIDAGDLSGVYKETGWQVTLSVGAKMRHTAKRMVVSTWT